MTQNCCSNLKILSFEFIFGFIENMRRPAGICMKGKKVYVTQFSSHCPMYAQQKGNILILLG